MSLNLIITFKKCFIFDSWFLKMERINCMYFNLGGSYIQMLSAKKFPNIWSIWWNEKIRQHCLALHAWSYLKTSPSKKESILSWVMHSDSISLCHKWINHYVVSNLYNGMKKVCPFLWWSYLQVFWPIATLHLCLISNFNCYSRLGRAKPGQLLAPNGCFQKHLCTRSF